MTSARLSLARSMRRDARTLQHTHPDDARRIAPALVLVGPSRKVVRARWDEREHGSVDAQQAALTATVAGWPAVALQ